MDPKHGEISRAMRNRGVEIFMRHEVQFDFIHAYSDFTTAFFLEVRCLFLIGKILKQLRLTSQYLTSLKFRF